MSPEIQFKAVDFPHPEGPRNVTNSPLANVREKLFKALLLPKVLLIDLTINFSKPSIFIHHPFFMNPSRSRSCQVRGTGSSSPHPQRINAVSTQNSVQEQAERLYGGGTTTDDTTPLSSPKSRRQDGRLSIFLFLNRPICPTYPSLLPEAWSQAGSRRASL